MSEYDARLRLVGAYDVGQGLRLEGDIFDDRMTSGNHPFRDGDRVHTSPLAGLVGRIATTRSGTRYRIEFPDEQPKPTGDDLT